MKERLSNIRIVCMWTDMVTLLGHGVRVVWCLCLSEESVKAVSPFCLVSTPGEVKDLTLGNRKTL